MTEPQQQDRKTPSLGATIAFLAAFFLTLYSLFINNITITTHDYKWLLIQAIGCASVALALIAATWRRLPGMKRAIAILLVLANLWTLLDAGGRRLPATLGW